jgi:hypothetical protein
VSAVKKAIWLCVLHVVVAGLLPFWTSIAVTLPDSITVVSLLQVGSSVSELYFVQPPIDKKNGIHAPPATKLPRLVVWRFDSRIVLVVGVPVARGKSTEQLESGKVIRTKNKDREQYLRTYAYFPKDRNIFGVSKHSVVLSTTSTTTCKLQYMSIPRARKLFCCHM